MLEKLFTMSRTSASRGVRSAGISRASDTGNEPGR
jgi:hypothetical protein